MRYLSVCSGIEAASVAWDGLMEPAAFSEIEKFPSAVLAARFPSVPNLGDMNNFRSWDFGAIDVLVGGTPCQSFSVAGLRKGLSDPRGNLALVYCGILERFKPRFFVWENVPGVLSSNSGKDFALLMDYFEELGYIVDIEILDAQFFGVPQRRRRVFVCGENAETLLTAMTPSSCLTMAQCLVEIFHGILIGQLCQSEKEPAKSVRPSLSADGLNRKMRLFGLNEEKNNFQKLLKCLEEVPLKFLPDAESLVLEDGVSDAEHMADGLLTAFAMELQSTLTDGSLRTTLEEAFLVMKSCITSTSIKAITNEQICTCFQAVLSIGRVICLLRRSCPPSWNAGYCFLTALEDYTDYARLASRSLFDQLCGIRPWSYFLREAEHPNIAIRCFGDWRRAAEVLFEREGVRGNPPKGAGKKQEVARALRGRASISHREDADTYVTHSLRGEGFDASEDGTGRGTPLVPVLSHACLAKGGSGRLDPSCETFIACTLPASEGGVSSGMHPVIAFDCKAGGNTGFAINDKPGALRGVGHGGGRVAIAFQCHGTNVGPMGTLRAGNGNESGGVPFMAFAENSRAEVRLEGGDGSRTGALSTGGGKAGQGTPMVASSMAVRRLTPRECERLQGFPDDWTLIEYRGKPAADGPRYKSIGNSMAVPCMRWIGERLVRN